MKEQVCGYWYHNGRPVTYCDNSIFDGRVYTNMVESVTCTNCIEARNAELAERRRATTEGFTQS